MNSLLKNYRNSIDCLLFLAFVKYYHTRKAVTIEKKEKKQTDAISASVCLNVSL